VSSAACLRQVAFPGPEACAFLKRVAPYVLHGPYLDSDTYAPFDASPSSSTTAPPIYDAVTADIATPPYGTATRTWRAWTGQKTRTRNATTGLPVLPQRATGKGPLPPASNLFRQGRVCGRMQDCGSSKRCGFRVPSQYSNNKEY
jgi:hypothetical protein